MRAVWDLVVALRGTVVVAAQRASRAWIVAAVAAVVAVPVGAHLVRDDGGGRDGVGYGGSGAEAPPSRTAEEPADDGLAVGGPLTGALSVSGDGSRGDRGDDRGAGPGADSSVGGASLTSGAVGDTPSGAGDDPTATTTPATTPGGAPSPTSAPTTTEGAPDPESTTTVPAEDGRSGIVGSLLDLLGL